MLAQIRRSIATATIPKFRSHSTQTAVADASSPWKKAPLIVEPVQHRSTLIFFHDRSDDPDRYRTVFTLLGQLASSIRLVLPWGPLDPDTDLASWSPSQPNPLLTSAVSDLVRQESNSCRNLFLGGLGEGADIALDIGLIGNAGVSGIMSFNPSKIPAVRHNQVPVLAFHGEGNQLLPVDEAKKKYRELGRVDFNADPSIAHTFKHEMFVQMCYWIQDVSK